MTSSPAEPRADEARMVPADTPDSIRAIDTILLPT